MLYIFVLAFLIACEVSTLPQNCRNETKTPINCTFETGAAKVDCPRESVIRVIGDYQNFSIHCSSEPLLRFNYDGTKPTEAIRINTWGDVSFVNDANQTPTVTRQHIKVEVLSVASLIEEYTKTLEIQSSNLTVSPAIYYSRSGKFNFDTITKSDEASSLKFVIFFEEPGVDPAFINRYEHNEGLKVIDAGNYFVSCRSTHYIPPAGWGKPELWLNTTEGMIRQKMAVYDPKTGFSVSSSEDQVFENTSFFCIIPHETNRSKNIKFDPKLRNPAELAILVTSQYARMARIIRRGFPLKLHGRCTPNDSTLNFIAARNPDENFLVRDFVLPDLVNRSLYLEKGVADGKGRTSDSVGVETEHGTALEFGALYCGRVGEYQLISFLTLFEPVAPDGDSFDNDWHMIQGEPKVFWPWMEHEPFDLPEIYLQLKHGYLEERYDCEDLSFRCTVHPFYLRPVVWQVVQNGAVTRQVEKNVRGKTSVLTTRLKPGNATISCLAAKWAWRDKWGQATTYITLIASEEPKFEQNQSVVYEFKPNTSPQIELRALGVPSPRITCSGQFLSEDGSDVEQALERVDMYERYFGANWTEARIYINDLRRTKLNCEARNGRGVDNITINIYIRSTESNGGRGRNAGAGRVYDMYGLSFVVSIICWMLNTTRML